MPTFQMITVAVSLTQEVLTPTMILSQLITKSHNMQDCVLNLNLNLKLRMSLESLKILNGLKINNFITHLKQGNIMREGEAGYTRHKHLQQLRHHHRLQPHLKIHHHQLHHSTLHHPTLHQRQDVNPSYLLHIQKYSTTHL